MAIARNLDAGNITRAAKGTRLTDVELPAPAPPPPRTTTTTPPPRGTSAPAAPSAPAPAPPAVPTPPPFALPFTALPQAAFPVPPRATIPAPPVMTAPPPGTAIPALPPQVFNFDPSILVNPGLILRPDLIMRTVTQIAQGALARLRGATPSVVGEALTTVSNKRVAPREMMRYLERKVIIGEVLNQPAAQWSADTRQDFADAFQMVNTKTDVMDAIVALAVLNDPDLQDELRDENVSDASGADLLENRRVVAQYPPPGTPLEAPYLVLVAVEYRDTRRADEVIESITGDLVEQQGFKVPRSVAQNLR